MVVELTLRPGSFAWRQGSGHQAFPEGARLRGELVRVNGQKRVAVIRSDSTHYTVNFEDLVRPLELETAAR